MQQELQLNQELVNLLGVRGRTGCGPTELGGYPCSVQDVGP